MHVLYRLISTSLLIAALGTFARAATVIQTTTTYSGPAPADLSVGSLSDPGAYVFDIVVRSTAGTGTPTVDAYIQQQGISGEFYTLFNSTMTQCTVVPCFRRVNPDIYVGGGIRMFWTVTVASATITLTAHKVSP